MDRESERIGLQEIIDKAIEEMAREAGDSFELGHLNLAEFSRRTGITRSRARTLKAKGFKVTPHGRCGMRAAVTVIIYGSGPNEFVVSTPESPVMRLGAAVITGDYAQRVNPDSFSRWRRENRGRLGVLDTTLHELRHSFLSIAAQLGVHSFVMQKLVGHNSSKITLDIYAHVNMDQQRMAMNAMQDVFK